MTYEELEKLRSGKKMYETFQFPFTPEIKIGVRVLSQDELIKCSSEGRRKADSDLYKPTKEDYDDYITREILYLSVVNFETGEKSFFPSPEKVAKEPIDINLQLLQYYREVQEKFNPVQTVKDEKDFIKLITEVKKNSLLGMSLSTHILRELLHFLIANPETLQKDNGFTSSVSTVNNKTSKRKPIEMQVLEKANGT